MVCLGVTQYPSSVMMTVAGVNYTHFPVLSCAHNLSVSDEFKLTNYYASPINYVDSALNEHLKMDDNVSLLSLLSLCIVLDTNLDVFKYDPLHPLGYSQKNSLVF